MKYRKFTTIFLFLCLCTAVLLLAGGSGQAGAIPNSPVDESKVPHYFGPYPNWANSPFAMPDAVVTIIGGGGSGAMATASVGAGGAITAITITDPGSGYTSAPTVIINNAAGTNSSAAATATFTPTGAVTGINIGLMGGGYTAPAVTITGANTAPATATAYGSIDSLTLDDPGTGYHMPTLSFDLPDDPNGKQANGYVVCTGDPVGGPYCTAPLNPDGTPGTVEIADVVLTDPGSGYATAPGVAILDGTQFDPIRNGATGAAVSATINVSYFIMDTFGAGYTAATVDIAETAVGGLGAGATATAVVETGAITKIDVTTPGADYVSGTGIRKFIDDLPGLCDPVVRPLGSTTVPGSCPDWTLTPTAKAIPLAVPDPSWADNSGATFPTADTYVIGLVQYLSTYSSDLPPTLTRGYVQLESPGLTTVTQHYPLVNDLIGGGSAPVVDAGGNQIYAVTPPQYLGPIIATTKDRPVRIVFYNLLPTGVEGNLFLPVDTTIMGSGPNPDFDYANNMDKDMGTVLDGARNPLCGEPGAKPNGCFTENRATLHLHGGITPWISDGTPHQWITPDNENTSWPEGVSVENVPDMDVCNEVDINGRGNDGCQTFYYTNQQSARFMFYHDHAWGITRLNVYAGEAAGYLITDDTDQRLINGGFIPSDQIPLVIQDKTFVPGPDQLAFQDPTWDVARWGGMGSMWAPHVYMPAQNPGDPTGMSGFGRWMYGAWFWPPARPAHGPIANPYFGKNPATGFTTDLAVPCNIDDPNTWQYDTDPFCEPEWIPGTPNISVGMEAFNDTPVVNGVAYPKVTLDPKAYRLRILNAANDRFWNLQWYVADATGTEVALNATELLAAQTDPVVFPTPDTTLSPPGPDWIQIGTEGGFLPAPVVVDGQQVTTWITDPTVFNVGNVDKHSLLLAPAERADVIVDFSQFAAGTKLILYNDAPAAFPARVPSYDYYTGGPDLWPVGAPTTLPGYGPNTRTVMQITISNAAPASAFNLPRLERIFKHKANGSGVFESGQNPIVVGQAAYNSAYGTRFPSSGWCNAPGSASTNCDGFARIAEQGGFMFGFNTLNPAWAPGIGKMKIPLQPKGIHDEMNSTNFDEYARMQANLGLEAPGATPLLQNIILYPFVNPTSEIFDGTNLPVHEKDLQVLPISSAADGTQIWKITHNGVDTHPIHWHLYDLQLLNRVTWDNIVQPPEPTELGWKDTIRISPLEDTIVAIRPIIPTFDFPQELPNSVRPLNPMMPLGSTMMFNNTDAFGNPTAPIVNSIVNFGWEYVFHCHILSHEEMDMMRPVSVAMPPRAPSNLEGVVQGGGNNRAVVLNWVDNSKTETSFTVRKGLTETGPWTVLGKVDADVTTFTYTVGNDIQPYFYEVLANNEVGYGGSYSMMTVTSSTGPVPIGTAAPPPAAPTNLNAVAQAGPQVLLTWTDNANNETGYVIQRAPGTTTNPIDFTNLITVGPGNNNMSYTDTAVAAGTTYSYRVAAANLGGLSAYSNVTTVTIPPPPPPPTNVRVTTALARNNRSAEITMTWTDVANETGYTVQRATDPLFTANLETYTLGANTTRLRMRGLPRSTGFYLRIQAFNGFGQSIWVNATPFPIWTP